MIKMSKKNYTKYAASPVQNEEVIEEVVEEVLPEVEETVEEVLPEVEAEVVEPEVQIEVVQDPLVIGIVVGCTKLYMREEPNKDSEPVCILEEFDEVYIDMSDDDICGDFYKVKTADKNGFCVKKYIRIK